MAKANCEACGEKLGFRNEFLVQGSSVCKACKDKFMAGEQIEEFVPKTPLPPHHSNATNQISTQFKALLGYGKFMSGLGWIVVIVGIIGIFYGLINWDFTGLGIAGIALIVIICGMALVASGQLFSCFVAIEKNTRATYEALKSKD
jgi:hypothetical protein